VKYFCNVRNAIPYIQNIDIINVFHDVVSDIKIIDEIDMKKPKTIADLIAVADVCIEASDVGHDSWNPEAWGPHERRMIVRSTQLTGTIAGTEETTDSAVSNPHSRKIRGIFSVLMTRKSGVKFTAPRGTIWRSAKFSWIRRRCHPQ
jgi:hypothetical protein